MRFSATALVSIALALGIAGLPGIAAANAQGVETGRPMEDLSAEDLLSRGETELAYFKALGEIESSIATSQMHVIAAKAALLEAKTAPLLRKKRWAKTGRDHFKSALELDENNADALLGLATFALRAPDKLGGGEAAVAQYSARLEAVSPTLFDVFQARVAQEKKAPGDAYKHYEDALKKGAGAHVLFEYATFAENEKDAARAYSVIVASSAHQYAACTSYLLGSLAGEADAAPAQQLLHFGRFIDSGEVFCGRKFVAIDAVDVAIELATALENAESLGMLRAAKVRIERGRSIDRKNVGPAS